MIQFWQKVPQIIIYMESEKESEQQIAVLMMDDAAANKKDTSEYVLSGEECCLNIRAFSERPKEQNL